MKNLVEYKEYETEENSKDSEVQGKKEKFKCNITSA